MKSTVQIIENQIRRREILKMNSDAPHYKISVITVNREPGSGGNIVAKGVAEKLGLELFHQEIVHEMAKSAKVSDSVIKTLDEHGLSVLEDYIASLIDKKHLWPDEYLHHLLKIIGTIGSHGNAVIVGRGATFILPKENHISIRVIAPKELRIERVSEHYNITKKEAERRIMRTNSDRKAFISKYFHVDAENPLHYHMTLNTGTMSIDAAVNAVCAVFKAQ